MGTVFALTPGLWVVYRIFSSYRWYLESGNGVTYRIPTGQSIVQSRREDGRQRGAWSACDPPGQPASRDSAARGSSTTHGTDVNYLVGAGRSFSQYERRRRYDAALGGRHGRNPGHP